MSGQGATITDTSTSSYVGANLTVEFRRIANPGSTKPTDPIKIITEWDVSGTGTYSQID
jgi:hypothetical protein